MIQVSGADAAVRGCDVLAGPDHGIHVTGARAKVLGNRVLAADTTVGVLVEQADGAIVGRNTVDGASTAVRVSGSRDVLVQSNRITRSSTGIEFAATSTPPAAGKYRGNTTSGVVTPYVGGTDAGGNE